MIAAVIIGGGSLLGGRGSVVGTIAGAAIMTIIQIGCSQQGLPNWVQQIVTGAIIVVRGGARSVAEQDAELAEKLKVKTDRETDRHMASVRISTFTL